MTALVHAPSIPVPMFRSDEASDAELTATLLDGFGIDRQARRRAADLLDRLGGLTHLARASGCELEDTGLEHDAIARLLAFGALIRRLECARDSTRPLDARSLDAMFRPALARLPHEELFVVLLDGRAHYLGRRRIAVGGDCVLSVHVREVLGCVVEARAPRFALVHNHPSGSSTPSPEDVALTDRIDRGARLLGLALVDHLVVAADGFASAMNGGSCWPGVPLRRVSC